MSFVLGMLAVTTTCVPGASPARPNAEIARDFYAAVKAHDEAALGSLIKPGALFVQGSMTIELAQLLTLLLAKDLTELQLVDVADTPGGAQMHTLTAGKPATANFKLEGGCITEMMQE